MDGLAKWWAIGLLPIASVAVWWLWWKLPKLQVAKLRDSIPDHKDRVEVEDTLRKTIGQALGAIAVLVGAGFALAQFLEQRDTAQKQIAVSQQQVQASHDLLISNQIAKGFEQLGSDKIEVRLGGIYALEGILRMPPPDNTSPDYSEPVLEALCAFVREHTIGKIVQDNPMTEHPTTDVQAVLTVIVRRPKELKLVDLSGAVVPGAVLQKANLSGANLLGANLSDASLSGADLRGADLTGANLRGANLNDAHLNGANLNGTNLRGANLNDAHLNSANLNGTNLNLVGLSYSRTGGNRFGGADLSDANLIGADLSGASLIYAILDFANLSDANLSDANLSDVSLDNQEQLSKACGKPKLLPEGFTLDRPCPPKNPK